MRLLSLASALRSWGLQVAEVDGWQGRGAEPFNPIGCLIHHTAGPRGADAPSLNVCINGRPGLRGPLCQVLISRSGVCHIIASAKCNHAGEGGPKGPIGPDAGNAQSVGIEAENDGVGEPWPAVQVGAMVRATAAVLDLLGQPRANVWGHREYTPRKIDPAGITMAQFRAAVAAARPPGATTVPTTATLPENDPGARIQRAINANGLQPPLKIDGQVGPATADGLDKVLAYLNGQVADLKAANKTSADTIKRLTAERNLAEAEATDIGAVLAATKAACADAVAKREAAEAEVTRLRGQLAISGGPRLGQLLADLDAALAKARA